MRILLTGGSGQVGRAFLGLAPRHEVVAPGHGDLPIEDPSACERVVAQVKPDWIVHPAAMTDVDGCERDPARAHAINALGAENLAKAAARHGCRMALISTDYVFDGSKGHYKESDPTNPLSHYGRSKLEGERLVLAALPAAVVARTSVVFGPHKNNFVLWVRRSLRSGTPVKVAHDQWVTPTCADDVAGQVLALVEAGESGLWHTAGSERMTRLEMAHRIAEHDGLDPGPIQSISTADLTWLAARPRDSSLDTGKVARLVRPMAFRAAIDTLGGAP
ncbi:MAG TPA: dTDP-4-dehydrorhamnose reductase [Candidatus Thermoplasmatota archaeon]|nr:dTDP-4-dehydrorhamnose reductase [Candidatus Thermoplasmatota archaeon]